MFFKVYFWCTQFIDHPLNRILLLNFIYLFLGLEFMMKLSLWMILKRVDVAT